MKKHEFETYEDFLKFQRKRAAEWYQANKEWKKAYTKARYQGEKITREQFELNQLLEQQQLQK